MTRSVSWLSDLVDLLLPAGCVACGCWIPARRGEGTADETDSLVCMACRARMRPGGWPRCERCHWPQGTGRVPGAGCRECAPWSQTIVAGRFCFELVPPVDDLVHGLKYEGWRELAPFMGSALAGAPIPVPWPDVVVVPVPTTQARLRGRGYNQAELLARVVARQRSVPLAHALTRPRGTGSQTALTADERRANVRGAFDRGSQAGLVKGRTVVLVDDVLTTGATASAAAESLSALGAERIIVLTFARAVFSGARRAA